MTSEEEALVFVCDEAACKEDRLFYELFTMDDRWAIIRAILKAANNARAAQFKSVVGTGKES